MSLNPNQLDSETLSLVHEQSADCVKLVDLAGALVWMNRNGLGVMEIPNFAEVHGQNWAQFWPETAQLLIARGFERAAQGGTHRFEADCPTMSGTPRWWEVSITGVRGRDGAMAGYLCISRDVTARWRDREALNVLMREMRHRLRNTYAILSGLMRGFAQGDPARELFADEMADRLMALAAAQSLFGEDPAPAALTPLLSALILPFNSPTCPIALKAPPALWLDRGSADAIALVVGELSVNSGKHGALRHGGSIAVTTEIAEGRLQVRWDERSGVPTEERRRDGGQGLELIQSIVAARAGNFDLAWRLDGLTATLGLALPAAELDLETAGALTG